jgi:hypothetical protein
MATTGPKRWLDLVLTDLTSRLGRAASTESHRAARPPHLGRSLFAVLILVASASLAVGPTKVAASSFSDIADSGLRSHIEWAYANGIVAGCTATRFCPDNPVTRAQMAAFLDRLFEFPATSNDWFTDDEASTLEASINRIAAAGVSLGCGYRRYCPNGLVRRDEMASFIARAASLTSGAGRNYFWDDTANRHEAAIDRFAAAGMTGGCGSGRYCPRATVTREQMAAFLHRVVEPGTPPPPQAGCTRTFGGDGSGSTDVAGALQDFVDDAANGSVLCLVAGATYRVDAPIRISHRSNLTLDGHGARLRSPVARDNAFITVNEGSGIALRNLVIEGANAAAGTSGALDRDRQHGHAFALEAVRSVLIEDTTVRRVFGDFVYVGTNSSLVWSDGVTIRNNDFALNGRMGVAVVAGRNVVIAGNSFDKVGMFTLDIEPNRYSPPTGGDNIEFSGNWVGSGTHTNLYGPLFFGALGSGNTTNVRILNNTLAGQALRIWVDPLEDHYVRRSFTISGNVSSVPMAGPAMRFTDVDGVTVTNNTQPLSSGQLVTTSGSTNVTISGNDITP